MDCGRVETSSVTNQDSAFSDWIIGSGYGAWLKYDVPTMNFNGGVMLWRYFSRYGQEPMVTISGTLNGEVCCNILDNHVLPVLW
ncbi:hypothetical protein TNIN_215291 [Trichonephila inaurata madagascariensis]|uniref:Uncharacterized protein n=1 Tax=Trichonephila inaurata madagascariensis TaxID=2747483 RepID=A0A8X7C8N4_9ARAC|nr:hypothetical protein TNIN_215291 [Trichonephila inaurata madagascariensis]